MPDNELEPDTSPRAVRDVAIADRYAAGDRRILGGRVPALSRPLLALTALIALTGAAAASSTYSPVPQRAPRAAAAVAGARRTARAATLAEVEVLGEQPGPGLWKVTKGDHVLWLLGTLDHVPRRMQWHSRAVESALADSQELLAGGPAVSAHVGPILLLRLYLQWRGMQKDPDRTRLQDWLPAPLYARFETLKDRYDARDRRIEKLRPPFAALRLYQRPG
ncbi:MAG: TraB/GumN family protein [Steroidobacteraceae bacterium]